MSDLLDLRSDLDGPLSRYRHAVSRLQAEIGGEPHIGAREADVDALWRDRVQVELIEIKEALLQHSLIRKLARNARLDLPALVAAAGDRGRRNGRTSRGRGDGGAALTAAAGTVSIVPRAVEAARTATHAVHQGDFYYLHKLSGARG